MTDLWSHPAVQGVLAPFVVALPAMLALTLPWRAGRFAGLAITLAFTTAVTFTVGWSFESMSSIRKLGLAWSTAATA